MKLVTEYPLLQNWLLGTTLTQRHIGQNETNRSSFLNFGQQDVVELDPIQYHEVGPELKQASKFINQVKFRM